MRSVVMVICVTLAIPTLLAGQQLRKVPQRFAYVQPVGLAAGIGTAGLEFAVGRRTTMEVGVLGVYTAVDDVQVYGGGGGVGFRRYFRSGEPAGMFAGLRLDGIGLIGRDALEKGSATYLGVGAILGHRWTARSGLIADAVIGYEALAGPRALIPSSRRLQEDLGLLVGLALGWSW